MPFFFNNFLSLVSVWDVFKAHSKILHNLLYLIYYSKCDIYLWRQIQSSVYEYIQGNVTCLCPTFQRNCISAFRCRVRAISLLLRKRVLKMAEFQFFSPLDRSEHQGSPACYIEIQQLRVFLHQCCMTNAKPNVEVKCSQQTHLKRRTNSICFAIKQ